MRIKQIIWVLTALVFANVLYAQVRSGGGAQQPSSQTQTQPGQSTEQVQQQGSKSSKAQAQGPMVMTEKELIKAIKNSTSDAVIKDVEDRGVDFDMAPDKEKKLRKAGATDAVISAIRNAGPTARKSTAQMVMGPGMSKVPIPREQADAFDVIKGELDPDKAVGLCDDFIKKYPDSVLVSYVDYFAANAYQQKGQAEKVVEYCDGCLKAKPDNLMCLIMKVSMVPQPQYINNHEADRDKILADVEKEGAEALQLTVQIPKNANESDADYQKRLAEISAQIHGSLGMVHLDLSTGSLAGPDKAELAKSEQEFKQAVTMSQHPDPRDYFRMGEAYAMDGKLDDSMEAFSKASELGQGTLIKTYADQRLAALKKQKDAAPAAH